MAEEWIVRVGGKEYGPVDTATLLEWKSEGRLLVQNEVRAASETVWIKAEAVPGLFAPPPLPEKDTGAVPPLQQRRTFSQIIFDSFRIYRRDFLAFLVLTSLVGIPTFLLEIATQPAYGIFPASQGPGLTRANLAALLALVLLLIGWPIFLAGIQFATLEVLEGRRVKLRDLFRRAVNYFPRFARLALIVYGSFLFCIAIPVLAILTLVSSPSLITIFLALVILVGQVIWFSYLWVNYLFWQQSAAIANLDVVHALRESRLLARSKRRPRWQERPLWRGALLVSLWIIILLGLSAGAEVPLVYAKMQNVATLEEAVARIQQLQSSTAVDPLTFWSGVIGAIVQALLRPILGISFVLLYFDARTDFTEAELTPPEQSS